MSAQQLVKKPNDINPNLLIIFDDCETSSWSKNEQFNELFYNGRHHKITMIRPKLQKFMIVENPTNDPIIALLNFQAYLFNQQMDLLDQCGDFY